MAIKNTRTRETNLHSIAKLIVRVGLGVPDGTVIACSSKIIAVENAAEFDVLRILGARPPHDEPKRPIRHGWRYDHLIINRIIFSIDRIIEEVRFVSSDKSLRAIKFSSGC